MGQGREQPSWEPELEEEEAADRLGDLFVSAEEGDSASQYQIAV